MRNPAIDALDVLVGEWKLTLSDAWFLESRDIRRYGHAAARWLGDAFIELVADFDGEPTWHFVFGRSDANDELIALYHDPRPTSRVFRMTYADAEWRMWRDDPDFHQRLVARVTQDQIQGQFDASEDAGLTWRKDFDLTFDRETSRDQAGGQASGST